jgi:hypothetical protein
VFCLFYLSILVNAETGESNAVGEFPVHGSQGLAYRVLCFWGYVIGIEIVVSRYIDCFLGDLEVAAFVGGAPCLALLSCFFFFVSEAALFAEMQVFSVSFL